MKSPEFIFPMFFPTKVHISSILVGINSPSYDQYYVFIRHLINHDQLHRKLYLFLYLDYLPPFELIPNCINY